MLLLGADIGTSSCKVALYSASGDLIDIKAEKYSTTTPKEGWVELPPKKVFSGFIKAVKDVLNNYPGEPGKIYLSFSILGDAVIPCAQDGTPLNKAILSSDSRSFKYVANLRERAGERRLYELTGRIPHSMTALTKILWLKEHFNSYDSEVDWLLDMQSWLIYKLGFEPLTDYSSACGTMFFDIKERAYSEELLDLAGIDKPKLPRLANAGEIVGELDESIVTNFDLPKTTSITIVLGAMDQPCNALGTTTVRPGDAVCSTGTVEATTTVLPNTLSDEVTYQAHLPKALTAIPKQYASMAFLWTGGGALRWLKDVLNTGQIGEQGGGTKDPYEQLTSLAKHSYSKVFFLPHLAGSGTPNWDPQSKGAFLGLNLATTKGDIVQALLEGVTFELRKDYENLKEAGVEPNSITVIGGGAKSSWWLQLKADILNTEIKTLKNKEAGCLGAAIIAGNAAGVFESLKQVPDKLIEVERVYKPKTKAQQYYDKKFRIHSSIYSELEKLNHRIHEFNPQNLNPQND